MVAAVDQNYLFLTEYYGAEKRIWARAHISTLLRSRPEMTPFFQNTLLVLVVPAMAGLGEANDALPGSIQEDFVLGSLSLSHYVDLSLAETSLPFESCLDSLLISSAVQM